MLEEGRVMPPTKASKQVNYLLFGEVTKKLGALAVCPLFFFTTTKKVIHLSAVEKGLSSHPSIVLWVAPQIL